MTCLSPIVAQRDGWTPLHWASRVGNLDIVRLLAKYGANLNVQDRWGTTPLMLTVIGEIEYPLSFNLSDATLCKQFGETLSYLGALHSQSKILELINNWREGNPIVVSHDDDEDVQSDSTESSENDNVDENDDDSDDED
ncbi:unnamed protein product [Phytophthora lilii]|uniref:Unnamed protein product n=1 Tax=Phytophthora lilii TaxID=2077276 RepID=A0A9W6WSW4_9STRA|nr:unnamed protein product [Phytophthora lilii]